MRVLVAMSGGVDSSVAASILRDAGHDVTGCTMRLWGGASDTGCCSVADVDDARRVAQQLDIAHYVFDFGDDFTAGVVEPYVEAHARGRTPNPCIECNRTVKFDRLLRRAEVLGFDAVATGHHARVEQRDGRWRLRRAVDDAKDQSYVLHMLDQATLARTLLPVGDLTKAGVRERAAALGLRTAAKPDSQDVCFITKGGRAAFLSTRVDFTPAPIVDTAGNAVGAVEAVQLVTVGQRRGLGLAGAAGPRYVVDVDAERVVIGTRDDLLVDELRLEAFTWVDAPVAGDVLVQCSAHGRPVPATVDGTVVRLRERIARVAPGQSVVLYRADEVLGGALVAA
jgi:tRNA-specific 2-thiouridylase